VKAEVRELQRLLGKKTMEVEILKDAIRIAREKNCYRASLAREGHYLMKAITDTMGVSGSCQYEPKNELIVGE
jgi:hypothetical protein